jgi:hypothetical protein
MKLLSWVCLLIALFLSKPGMGRSYNIPDNTFNHGLLTSDKTKQKGGFYKISLESAFNKSCEGKELNSGESDDLSLAASYSAYSAIIDGFTAVLDKKNVIINWIMASEINLDKFILERSTDGKNYKDVAVLFPGDSYSSRSYMYKDQNVSSSTNLLYYKLRCIDNSDGVSHSLTRVIRLKENENTSSSLAVYPNPSSDQVRITFPDSWQGKEVRLELYNNSGLKIQALQVKNAGQTETMQISKLPAGFYLINAVCQGAAARQGIVKN